MAILPMNRHTERYAQAAAADDLPKLSREQYCRLAEQLPAITYIVELLPSPHTVYVSPQVQAMLGFTPEEWLADPRFWLHQVDPADRARIEAEILRHNETGNSFFLEYRVRTRAGRTLWLHNSAAYLMDGTGRPIAVHGVMQDITDRKRAEEARRESEEKYRLFFESAGDAIFIHDENGRMLAANPVACEQLGCGHAEVLAMTAAQVDSPTEAVHVPERIARLKTNGRLEFETTHRRKDGTLFPVDVKARLIAWGGQPAVMSICRDITDRQRAEAELRERETNYFDLFNTVKQAIYIQNLDATFVNVNQGAVDMYGYAREEFVGKTPELLAAPGMNDLSRLAGILDRAFHGEPQKFEFWGRKKDGTVFPKDVWVVKGTYLGRDVLISLANDITERKQTEQALRNSEDLARQKTALLKSIMESPQGIIIFSLDGAYRYTEFTSSHKETMKALWDVEIEVGMNMLDAISNPGDRDRARQNFDRALQGEFLLVTEEYGDPSRQRTGYENRYSPIRDKSGAVCGLTVFVIDITERIRAEETLRRHQSYLSAIVGNQPGLIWLKDADSRFLSVNAAFAQSCGLDDPALLVGKSDLDVWPRELALQYIADDARVMASGTSCMVEEFIFDHGERKWFETFKTPIIDKQGKILGTTGYSRDISERKRAEAEKARLETDLHQAQKMESIGRLAGGVAHDFNNMLTVILGRAELALEQMDPALPVFADLAEIRKSAERSANLTRQLLAFARKQTIAPQVLNLNEIIAGMLQMLKRLIGENIDLGWQPEAKLEPVRIDPSQIDQILANLCINARDAIAGVGRISIATENATFADAFCAEHAGFAPGNFAVLSVSDTGSGMDAETLAHIFEPFFTTKGVGAGTGLGLATVYGIVKQNRGFITVDSQPGHGTIFKIHLPRHAGADRPRTESPRLPAARGGETILLVEDEPAILHMAAKMIAQQGYTVLAADNPETAGRLAREHAGNIHLLMTDVVMPAMNGWDLAQQLLALHPKLKCLFTSGYPADVITRNGVLDDSVFFIQKPFATHTLAAKIREALDSGRPARA